MLDKQPLPMPVSPVIGTPRDLTAKYLRALEARAPRSMAPSLSVQLEMTAEDGARYLDAALMIASNEGSGEIGPSVLFQAADAALRGRVSGCKSRIGIYAGTFDPIHYGHTATALASALVDELDAVLVAPGGLVPDKPAVRPFAERLAMVKLALKEAQLGAWLFATPIRQQIIDMFASHVGLATASDTLRQRSLTDIAAFIWLLRANPGTTWTYVAGSDKVAGYGRKGERWLVQETLGAPGSRVHVLYHERSPGDLDVTTDVEPYGWMRDAWRAGLFTKSPLPTVSPGASRIRSAIFADRADVDGIPLADCVNEAVLRYINGHPAVVPIDGHLPGPGPDGQ